MNKKIEKIDKKDDTKITKKADIKKISSFNKKKKVIPNKKLNSSISTNPSCLEKLYNSIKIKFVSTSPGFVRTAMNGIIDAIPMVSSKHIIIMKNNSNKNFFLSPREVKLESFFK